MNYTGKINRTNRGANDSYQKSSSSRNVQKVFSAGVSELETGNHIRLDSRNDPVQHAPRQVPVVLRDLLKEILDDMVQ